MRFYKGQHAFYCGVDLHAKTMHLCLVNQAGEVLVHRNLHTRPDRLLSALAAYTKQDLVVGVECMFTWYWLADLCAQHGIAFVLGHGTERYLSNRVLLGERPSDQPVLVVAFRRRFPTTTDLIGAAALSATHHRTNQVATR